MRWQPSYHAIARGKKKFGEGGHNGELVDNAVGRTMTESEWDWPRPRGRSDVLRYVEYLREERNSHRKALLTLCALCRITWHVVTFECNRRALEASEDYADGTISKPELEKHWRNTRFEPVVYSEWVCAAAGPAEALANWSPLDEQDYAALTAFHATFTNEGRAGWWAREHDFAMDVLDFAFCGAVFRPEWRTADVMGLARGIYYERAFERMPILADALMDAGCDEEQIIGHCRGDRPHVRGCWVVDLVLGKE